MKQTRHVRTQKSEGAYEMMRPELTEDKRASIAMRTTNREAK